MTEGKKSKKASADGVAQINPVKVRADLRINQTKFWNAIGVTQSGGSRYETGRKIPKPVQILLVIAYGTSKQAQAAIDKLRGEESK